MFFYEKQNNSIKSNEGKLQNAFKGIPFLYWCFFLASGSTGLQLSHQSVDSEKKTVFSWLSNMFALYCPLLAANWFDKWPPPHESVKQWASTIKKSN